MKALRPRWDLAPLLAAVLLSVPSASAQEGELPTERVGGPARATSEDLALLTEDDLVGDPADVLRSVEFGFYRGYFPQSSVLLGGWRFQVGDSMAWADPSYDDHAWQPAHTWFDWLGDQDERVPEGLPGIGWFRLYLRADSAVAARPLGLSLWRGGAAEVYLDGQLVHEVGKVGRSLAAERVHWNLRPSPIQLQPDSTHVLAVRYSNFSSADVLRIDANAGFYVILGDWEAMWRGGPGLAPPAVTRYARSLVLGILLALAFVHGVLFVLHPPARQNLYFALFATAFAGYVLAAESLHYGTLIATPDGAWLQKRLMSLFYIAIVSTLLRFAYSVAHDRLPRSFYLWLAGGVIIGAATWLTPYARLWRHLFFLAALLNILRVFGVAVLRRRRGAWIVGLGLLPSVTMGIYFLLSLLGVPPLANNYAAPPAEYGVYLLVLSMSVYLARDFARTKRGLALANARLEDYSRTLEHKVEARTRELQTEKEKTEAQARHLQDLDRAKSRFFANVSHEFRTPLTLILGPTESALQGTYGPLPAPLRRQLERTRHHARRLLRLVGHLLDLARLESGKLTLHAQRADLVPFLQRIARAFTPLAERERLTLSFRSDVGALPLAFDAEKLEQVVANLLSNALKFTPEGGKVWVTLTTPPGNGKAASEETSAVEVVVKDTGPGIAEQDLERIFDRFEQVDGSATRAHEGTGIGLSLARELVELHGGRLLVRSERGFGSAFIVRLPLTADEEDLAPESAVLGDGVAETSAEALTLDATSASVEGTSEAPADVSPADAPVVLVVEDNADVRAFLREELEARYRIVEAADGEAGLAAARQHTPDLVLSDVMMPKLDGYALCQKLKADERLRHVPVVLLTAKAAEADALQGLTCGADDYLSKPFSAEALRARVANLLASRRQLRAQFSREFVVQPSGVVVASEEEAFLERVLAVIESADGGEYGFGVEALAEEVGVSARQLRRRVRAVTGESPGALVRRMRLERASAAPGVQGGNGGGGGLPGRVRKPLALLEGVPRALRPRPDRACRRTDVARRERGRTCLQPRPSNRKHHLRATGV